MSKVLENTTAGKPLDTLIDELYGTSAQTSAREAWVAAVHTVADKAKDVLPESHTRIDKAAKIVLSDGVELLDGNKAKITSQGKEGVQYYIANGTCDCEDYEYRAPAGWCKHRLARALYLRAARMIEETTAVQEETPAVEAPPSIPQQYLVTIQGKPFIRYAGLLQMASARGLVSLTAVWTYNDADLSLAHAVATFADGRRFEECGDASPANTGKTVALHFRRVALTRSKARVLRDALGIDLVAVEELADN